MGKLSLSELEEIIKEKVEELGKIKSELESLSEDTTSKTNDLIALLAEDQMDEEKFIKEIAVIKFVSKYLSLKQTCEAEKIIKEVDELREQHLKLMKELIKKKEDKIMKLGLTLNKDICKDCFDELQTKLRRKIKIVDELRDKYNECINL